MSSQTRIESSSVPSRSKMAPLYCFICLLLLYSNLFSFFLERISVFLEHLFVLSYHNWQKMQVKCEFRYFLKFFKFFSKKHLHFLQTSCIISEYGSLVKRLRRRPLTAKTGVRFPYELLKVSQTSFSFKNSVLYHMVRWSRG